MKSGGFHTDFMKSSGFHTDFMKSSRFHEIRRISYGFHEIQQISYGFHMDFMKSGRFHADFTMKSSGFHEICEIWWISGEIQQISPRYHLWNPKIIKESVSAKPLQFDECRVGAMTKDFMKSTRFHPDFTCEIHPNYKSKCFSKNSSVWWMQGGGFHPWNPSDLVDPSDPFVISPLKSSGFYPKIWWIWPVKWKSCEIERPLARNCNPMFLDCDLAWHFLFTHSTILICIKTAVM